MTAPTLPSGAPPPSTLPPSGAPARRAAPVPGPAGVVRPPGRSRRLPWVALGLLLTSGAVLAFALFTITQSSRTLVWVAGVDVTAGDAIDRSDLVLVAVGADPGVELLEQGDEALVLGSVARGPIPAGTPLSAALVVPPGESVPAGFSVVGARLQPGQYPSSRLAAGDRVELLVAGPTPTGLSAKIEPATSLGTALVWAIDDSAAATSGALFVSLQVPAELAPLAASAGAADRLRLALVNASAETGPLGGTAGATTGEAPAGPDPAAPDPAGSDGTGEQGSDPAGGDGSDPAGGDGTGGGGDG